MRLRGFVLSLFVAAAAAGCGGGGDRCEVAARNVASIRFPKAPAAERTKRIQNMVGLCKRKGFSASLTSCYRDAKSATELDACDAETGKQGKSGVETADPH